MPEPRYMIAVVDDDPRILESLENLLESAGYEILTFLSAQALMDHGLAGINCLVTDIGMPGMNGLELCEFVQQARPGLPVFLITGRHEIGDQDRVRAKNISGFFRKPFDGPTLLEAIGAALHL